MLAVMLLIINGILLVLTCIVFVITCFVGIIVWIIDKIKEKRERKYNGA